MERIKNFFSITNKAYQFEIYDLTTFITILNVSLVLMGLWFAPFLGIANCIIGCILNTANKAHINAHITQVALIILNIYFLTL
jgi:hypothetical protein